MNATSRNILNKKSDAYKTSAARVYGFATFLAIDDCLKSIIRQECKRIGIQATEEQLNQVSLDNSAVETINNAVRDIINDYSERYRDQAIPEMQKELNDRGIYVRIGFN